MSLGKKTVQDLPVIGRNQWVGRYSVYDLVRRDLPTRKWIYGAYRKFTFWNYSPPLLM